MRAGGNAGAGDLLVQDRVTGVAPGAGEQEMRVRRALREQRRRAQKISLIFHGVIAADQSDYHRVLRQAQLGSQLAARRRRGYEPIEVEAIWNNFPPAS